VIRAVASDDKVSLVIDGLLHIALQHAAHNRVGPIISVHGTVARVKDETFAVDRYSHHSAFGLWVADDCQQWLIKRNGVNLRGEGRGDGSRHLNLVPPNELSVDAVLGVEYQLRLTAQGSQRTHWNVWLSIDNYDFGIAGEVLADKRNRPQVIDRQPIANDY
jgi:hypothetical protein